MKTDLSAEDEARIAECKRLMGHELKYALDRIREGNLEAAQRAVKCYDRYQRLSATAEGVRA